MRQRRDDRSAHLDPPPIRPAAFRRCDRPGCTEPGEFRAPRSRDDLRVYQWLCLNHVREFNRGWDFFAGMSAADIERHRRADVTWHRPTWQSGAHGPLPHLRIVDPLGVFAESDAEPAPPRRTPTKAEEMLARLGLDARAERADVKERYKSLVKRHHPDLHGGDRAAEERLKLINEAYTYLMRCGIYA